MVTRGTSLPLGQPLSHTHPGPASRHSLPLYAHNLQLYLDYVSWGIWFRLVFETSGGREKKSLFCSPQPHPGPASRHSLPLYAHNLQLYLDYVSWGIWFKLVFETSGGREKNSLFCSPQPHPGPASRHSLPLYAHNLQLYLDSVSWGIWFKLVFETSWGREKYSLFCSPQPRAASSNNSSSCRLSQTGQKEKKPSQLETERTSKEQKGGLPG